MVIPDLFLSIWWGFGLFLILGSMTYLILDKKQKKIVLSYFLLNHNRQRASTTPPRSLSPNQTTEKKPWGEDTYEDVFPPSRRFVLDEMQGDLSKKLGKPVEELVKSPTNSRTSCVPQDMPWDTVKQPAYTATEFSVEEIQALGDFPDYARLSGVPPPQPYLNFDISKAIPRPYRPFRWAYHQTMCIVNPSHGSGTIY